MKSPSTSLSRRMEEALSSNFSSLLLAPQVVDFGYDLSTNKIRNYNAGIPSPFCYYKYTMLMSTDIGKPAESVVCLFPNHPKSKCRILRSTGGWSLNGFNSELNKRFKQSLGNTKAAGPIRFAVCYGEHVYHCKDIEGTIYIVWPEYINCTSTSNIANNICSGTPVIFNLDGQGIIQCIYILQQQKDIHIYRVTIKEDSPRLLFPLKPIFVCEVRPPPAVEDMTITVSRSKAVEMATTQTSDQDLHIKKQRNPFAKSVDQEEEDEEEIEPITAGVSFDVEIPSGLTPRNNIFIEPVNRDPFDD